MDLGKKMISVEQALSLVKSNDHIVSALAPAEGAAFLGSLHTIAVTVTSCLPMGNFEYMTNRAYADSFNVDGWFFTPALRKAMPNGNVSHVPQQLSTAALKRLCHLKCNIFIGNCSMPDKHGYVSLGLSKRFSVEDMEELYAGIRLACEEYGVDIVGGDTSSSYTGLTISITCIGEGEKGKVVYRNGAKETDLICVSGDLGAAYMGLQLLEREKSVLKGGDKDLQPDFAGKEYLLERQLKPEARRDIIQKLAKEGIQPTSMMDVSDGLSSELLHICTQSKVGCRIYEEHIPIDYQTAVMAEEFNMNLTTCALNGGEDYELLFTVPIADHEKVSEMEGIKLIGHITKPELGCALISRDGQEFELKAQGWNPLKEESAAQQEEVE